MNVVLRENSIEGPAYGLNCRGKEITEGDPHIVSASIASDCQGQSESVPPYSASAAGTLRPLKIDQYPHNLEIRQLFPGR
jgi:hypothetical protein